MNCGECNSWRTIHLFSSKTASHENTIECNRGKALSLWIQLGTLTLTYATNTSHSNWADRKVSCVLSPTWKTSPSSSVHRRLKSLLWGVTKPLDFEIALTSQNVTNKNTFPRRFTRHWSNKYSVLSPGGNMREWRVHQQDPSVWQCSRLQGLLGRASLQ